MTTNSNTRPATPAPDLSSPTDTMTSFAAHVLAGDLDALIQLYEPDAVFRPSSGEILTGTAEIRAGLAQLLALKPTMNVEVAQVLTSGDTALVVNDWSMTGTAPDGTEVTDGGRSADVLRCQADGRWLVLIDHP